MYSATFAWTRAVRHLEDRLGPMVATTWLDDAEVVELKEDTLIVFSPSDFRQEQIRRICQPHIEECLKELFQREISLVVWGESELKQYRSRPEPISLWTCNPQFSFDNYIAGTSNTVPLMAATHVADQPGDSLYNPLYLYGPPGVGKTHLLYAIANAVTLRFPGLNVVYVKGEQFTNELIQSILTSSTLDFKEKYRQADLLLVDDIQFIAGKESTQEEFFHTFNHLFERKKQIVITSDRKPGDMATLEDRLKSRFSGSVIFEIKAPNPDTRMLIIRDKARKLGLPLDEASVRCISDRLCDNVRQLEGALRKIRVFRDLAGMELTPENISRTIEDIQSAEAAPAITPDLIVRYVCRYYGIQERQLKSQLRSRNIAEPRQVAMYLIRHMTKSSFPEMAQYFDRDHSSVLHSVKKVETALKNRDTRLEEILKEIRSSMESSL